MSFSGTLKYSQSSCGVVQGSIQVEGVSFTSFTALDSAIVRLSPLIDEDIPHHFDICLYCSCNKAPEIQAGNCGLSAKRRPAYLLVAYGRVYVAPHHCLRGQYPKTMAQFPRNTYIRNHRKLQRLHL